MCYQCDKDGPEFLFGKLSIRDKRDEPYFPVKRKLLLGQIRINTFFKKKHERKRKKRDRNIHKDMIIPVDICIKKYI